MTIGKIKKHKSHTALNSAKKDEKGKAVVASHTKLVFGSGHKRSKEAMQKYRMAAAERKRIESGRTHSKKYPNQK